MAANATARVHVAFSPSGLGSLKLALKTMGRDEEVLGLADDLSFGPIDVRDVHERMQWGVDELGFDPSPEIEAHIEAFWRRIEAVRVEIVAWTSRRHVSEYCGFLELLRRAKGAPISCVNVADIACAEADGSPIPILSTAFSWIPPHTIVENDLINRATSISAERRSAYEGEWQRLRKENAPLRVLTTSGLVSAPITHFDNLIRSCVSNTWERCAVVVGRAIRKTEGEFCQCSGDQLLFNRLQNLVKRNEIDGKKEQERWTLRDGWVRRTGSVNW